MTINEALDYIHAVDWRRSSLGLSRIDELPAHGLQDAYAGMGVGRSWEIR